MFDRKLLLSVTLIAAGLAACGGAPASPAATPDMATLAGRIPAAIDGDALTVSPPLAARADMPEWLAKTVARSGGDFGTTSVVIVRSAGGNTTAVLVRIPGVPVEKIADAYRAYRASTASKSKPEPVEIDGRTISKYPGDVNAYYFAVGDLLVYVTAVDDRTVAQMVAGLPR